MRYRTIVADPPWDHDELFRPNTVPRIGLDGVVKYGVMKLAAIKALPVSEWAETDAHLYVWTTNAFMEQAHQVCREWGFTPRSVVTWVKTGLGMGRYFRTTTEHAVFAVRGRYFRGSTTIPTHFLSPKTPHSVKPDALLAIAETMSPAPRLEMFARRRRDGWDAWGDQVPSETQMLLDPSNMPCPPHDWADESTEQSSCIKCGTTVAV